MWPFGDLTGAPSAPTEPTVPTITVNDATINRLTVLLLAAQRKGEFTRSMHDLATKLLTNLSKEK